MAAVLLAAACSPKTQPVSSGKGKPANGKTPAEVLKEAQEKAAAEAAEKKKKEALVPEHTPAIALILPFGLDQLSPGKQYSAAGLKKASIAIDYYRGFKMALDSLAADGNDFKLHLFDSKDAPSESHSLALNPQIKQSDLIVGPVFPEGVKAFTAVPGIQKNLVVSPLAPTAPQTYQANELITAIPPLEYHAVRAAAFVHKHIHNKTVYVLMSGYSDEKPYISSFKKALDSLSHKKINVVAFNVSKGNFGSIINKLSRTGNNFFVIPSTRQAFLKTTLFSLDTLSNNFPVTVVGHPSWDKLSFLKGDQMQKLNAYITSGDRVNYKASATIAFVQNYRKLYHAEPSEYAVKAFDEGMFFGKLLSKNELKDIGEKKYKGLHNSFGFIYMPGQGWINAHVMMLRYQDYDLKEVE